MAADVIRDPSWTRVCPHCQSDDLRVVSCRAVCIDNGRGVPICPDGFTFRHVGYDTEELLIRCGKCDKQMPWEVCPRAVPESRAPTLEDIADAAIMEAMLEGALP